MPQEELDKLALNVNQWLYEDIANDMDVLGIIRQGMNNIFGEEETAKYYAGDITDLEQEKVFANQYSQIETILIGRILLHLGTRYMEYSMP